MLKCALCSGKASWSWGPYSAVSQPCGVRNPILSIHPETERLSWAVGTEVDWGWGWVGGVQKFGVTDLYSLVLQLRLTLCNPMDCSPPGSSVHGIL